MSTTTILLALLTGTRNFVKEIAEPHRLIMKEQTMHSDASRLLIQQSRSYPVVNGISRGTRRTKSKLTFDVAVPNVAGDGNIVAPYIVDVNVSAPVGRSLADTDEVVALAAAYIASAEFRALIENGELADA